MWRNVRSSHERIPAVLTWFAVLTKPRAEALAVANLTRQGYQCLFPRTKRWLRSAAGMVHKVESLFPRYVFLNANPDLTSLAPVRSTQGVCGIVRFGLMPAPVPARVVDAIQARIDADDGFVRLKAPELSEGARVRVTEGPFGGLEGVFQTLSGPGRVRLLLDFLGTQHAVDVPTEHLVASL